MPPKYHPEAPSEITQFTVPFVFGKSALGISLVGVIKAAFPELKPAVVKEPPIKTVLPSRVTVFTLPFVVIVYFFTGWASAEPAAINSAARKWTNERRHFLINRVEFFFMVFEI